jgi:predicted Holliday junction resolvase-like endonuclease
VVDGEGKTDSDTIKITIVARTEPKEDDEKTDISKVLRNIFIFIIILSLVLVVFLVIRNQRLKQEWEERKQEMMNEREEARGRRPRDRRRPPSRPRERENRTGGSRMDKETSSRLPSIKEDER